MVKRLVLELGDFTQPEQIYPYLQDVLALPETCETVDDIYDFLTEIEDKMIIILPQAIADDEHLGEYGERLLTAFEEAAGDNENLVVELI